MSRTILYVEDSVISRDVLSEFLLDKCDKLLLAENGLDGLQKFNEHLPDLVISDIKMPKMSGVNMVEKIRENNKNVPIILISAYGRDDERRKATELGIYAFVQKPFDLDMLDSLIGKIFEN
jgi:CheY-like chemotaxis protein